MLRLRRLLLLAALAAVLAYAVSAPAQTIIDEWPSVKAPPAPELKPVTVDPKTTALLVMDLIRQSCNNERRPRCVASVPKIAKLLADARAKGLTVIYSMFPSRAPSFPAPVISDILPAIAPKGNEPVVVSNADKFIFGDKDTGLQKMLKDKGITTVITVGTAANGAVLYTASAASLRGFNVIVPVDGMSGDGQNTYIEQYVVFNLANVSVISSKITLTSLGMIRFAKLSTGCSQFQNLYRQQSHGQIKLAVVTVGCNGRWLRSRPIAPRSAHRADASRRPTARQPAPCAATGHLGAWPGCVAARRAKTANPAALECRAPAGRRGFD